MFPTRDRIRAMCVLGAIGDAYGVPVENYTARQVEEFGPMPGYQANPKNPWAKGKSAGQSSDDTVLSVAVDESVIETGRVDLHSMMRWHLKLWDEYGDQGFGPTTRDAMERARQGIPPTETGKTDKPNRGMGNALPMKSMAVGALLASPAYAAAYPGSDGWKSFTSDVIAYARMTHDTTVGAMSAIIHAVAIQTCLMYPETLGHLLIPRILDGLDMSADFGPETKDSRQLIERLKALNTIDGVLGRLSPVALAALLGGDPFHVGFTIPFCYAMFIGHPFTKTMTDIVKAGGDTDTNASIVGAMIGARNGMHAVPDHLLEGLWMRERILDTAERLCDRLDIKE